MLKNDGLLGGIYWCGYIGANFVSQIIAQKAAVNRTRSFASHKRHVSIKACTNFPYSHYTLHFIY